MTEENQPDPATPGENMPAWREVFLYFLMLGFIRTIHRFEAALES